MSQVIPSPQDCCQSCESSGGTAIPGPQGDPGAEGADGTNGVSAFTTVANYNPDAQPIMPAEGASVTVNTTGSTAFMAVGQPVFIQFWGTLFVTAVPTSTSVTVQNPEDAGTGEYASNAAPGTSLPAASKIVPGGIQGVSGETPAGALLAVNDLSDLSNVALARTNLGLGDVATLDVGTADNEIVQVDDAAGLTAGEAVFATANGVESQTASAARASLGLGTIATQAASAVAITGGAINATTVGATTPSSVAATTLGATGSTTLQGGLFLTSSSIQSLLAATTVLPNASKIRVVGNGGPVTLTAIPTISNSVADGQRLLILGTDDTNIVTFQDETGLAGSGLNLGAATRALGAGDTLDLIWDATMNGWFEVGFTNN